MSEKHKDYFNAIGEIFPTIVYNGKCIGLWKIDIANKKLNISIDSEVEYYDKQLVNDERERMENLLLR